jgi:hypothetical protein
MSAGRRRTIAESRQATVHRSRNPIRPKVTKCTLDIPAENLTLPTALLKKSFSTSAKRD